MLYERLLSYACALGLSDRKTCGRNQEHDRFLVSEFFTKHFVRFSTGTTDVTTVQSLRMCMLLKIRHLAESHAAHKIHTHPAVVWHSECFSTDQSRYAKCPKRLASGGFMKRILFAAAPVVALLLLTAGAQRASADTWYCGATQCSSSVPASGNYWIVNDTMTLGAGSSFDFKISFASVAGDPSAYLQDFSGQFFFGGTQLTNLSLTQANGWTDLEASKAGNNGTCNGNAPGSFCASSTGSSMILLTTSPTLFE